MAIWVPTRGAKLDTDTDSLFINDRWNLNQFFNFNLLQPMASLPVQIYTYAVSPYEDWHTKAWGSSLVLIVVIGGLSLATRLATRGSRLS